MKKTIIIALILLVISIVSFIILKQTKGQSEFIGTQDQLMLRGGNYYCTFTNRGQPEIDIPGNSGYFYISDIKAKGYIKSEGGRTISVSGLNIIRDGNYIYRWNIIESNGKDTIIDSPTKNIIDKERATSYLLKAGWNSDGTQKYVEQQKEVSTYNCENWKPDFSIFEIPKDITFDTNSDLIY